MSVWVCECVSVCAVRVTAESETRDHKSSPRQSIRGVAKSLFSLKEEIIQSEYPVLARFPSTCHPSCTLAWHVETNLIVFRPLIDHDSR